MLCRAAVLELACTRHGALLLLSVAVVRWLVCAWRGVAWCACAACPNGINKGAMAERMVDLAQSGGSGGEGSSSSGPGVAERPLDYVLCIGDDSSDELMFQALHSKFGMHPAEMDLFTVTVGRKPSKAQAYLGDHTEVVELLKMLSSVGNAKSKRFASMGDLVKLDEPEPARPPPAAAQTGLGATAGHLPQRRPRSMYAPNFGAATDEGATPSPSGGRDSRGSRQYSLS